MSDQPPPLIPGHSVAPQGQAIETVQQATNVSWERNSSLLAKNQFAFTGPSAAPVTFKFQTASKADFAEAMAQQKKDKEAQDHNNTHGAHPPAIPTSPTPPTLPPTLPPSTPAIPSSSSSSSNAPIPIGNFVGTNKWAAYHNPTTNKPYFYCHALKITTSDCPSDISVEFSHQYELFLKNRPQNQTPQVTSPTPPHPTPSIRPPPGFSRTNSQQHTTGPNSHLPPQFPPHLIVASNPLSSPTPPGTSPAGSVRPPVFPPLPPTPSNSLGSGGGGGGPPPFPPMLHAAYSSSQKNNLAVNVADPDSDDDDNGYQDSQASEVTVNHITTPMNRGPSFSFANDISNPTKLPIFIPKRHPIAENPEGHDLPEQHPLASVLQKSRDGLHPLQVPLDGSQRHTPSQTPRNSMSTSHNTRLRTHSQSAHHLPFDPKSPSHQNQTLLPLLDKTVPFSELFKVDALPTQKEGTFLKLTTGFRKSWRPRYIILHQGSLRWWDDVGAFHKAMTAPNAIISIVGCSAQLPPIGSHIHPKNGLYIDGNVGSVHELIDKMETTPIPEFEQASFFIRTDHLGEIDSWMHLMYRNGVIDARYVLNPDLNSKNLESVQNATQRLYEIWCRERVSSGRSGFQVAQTPTHSREQHDVDRTSTTQVFINPSDLVAAAAEISTTNSTKGMYVPGGLYGHQPIPVPVQINNKKRANGSYFAVLFTDRIECYETYDDASLVCRYSNPDLNNSINPDTITKPKLAYMIPITRDSTIELKKTSITNTYNEITLHLQVHENSFRNIKKQDWHITFEECNPVTGHPLTITNPSTVDPNKSLADTPGTSLSVAQKWFTVIEYCLEGPLSGTFGSSLWWSITRSTIPLPLVLHNCFRFIAQKGLQEEGILRVPGNNQHIIRLRRIYDSSQIDTTLTDPNTAAGLFKLFLRENKDGLVPRSVYKQWTSHNCRSAGAGASIEKRQPCVNALKLLVDQLPPLNHLCLAYVISMLTKISANASVNKMFPKNCAMVLAPNLFRAPKPENAQGLMNNDKNADVYASPQAMAEALAEQESIILILIEHFAEIFPRGSPFP
jgi:hypothetical protein